MREPNVTAPAPQGKRAGIGLIALLQLAVLLFSCTTLLTKFAAQYDILSWKWILYYGFSMVLLGVYAICWQQFLKRIPLTTAYANRSVAMFWSMLFGALLFQERISWNMIAGVIVIFIGVYLVVNGDAE